MFNKMLKINRNCETVVNFPVFVKGKSIFLILFSIAIIRTNRATAMSLTRTRNNSSNDRFLFNTKAIKIKNINNLSAKGSKNFPNFVIFLNFLAKNPSITSVTAARIINIKAVLKSDFIKR